MQSKRSYRVLSTVGVFGLLLVWFTTIPGIWAQNPSEIGQVPSSAGEASGPAPAGLMNAKKRLFTAGGFVDGAPIMFVDISKQASLDKFHHRSGTPDKTTIIEAPGSGVALLDFDNDGWLDIYLLNG